MPYLDLLNTVGIPDEIYASGLLGYGEAPSFTHRLSDSQTVQIHFDSRQTIKGYQIERGSDHTSFLNLQHSKKISRSILNKKEGQWEIKTGRIYEMSTRVGFRKASRKEAPLEKGSPEEARRYARKEPEVVEVPAFQEEVKQEEERKDEPAIGEGGIV